MRRKKTYFKIEHGTPAPLTMSIKHRISFSEVDAMAILWHGRYSKLFEEAAEKLMHEIGLSYKNYFDNNLRGPVVKFHVDYFRPLVLAELVTVEAMLIWTPAARLNVQYSIKKEDGAFAAAGYTVQMFIDAESNEPCLVPPPLLEGIRSKWQNGEFECLS